MVIMVWPLWVRAMPLRLTGDSIPASFVEQQLRESLENQYGREVRIPILSFPPILKHQVRALTVPVIFADGRSEILNVDVISESVPKAPNAFLLFSDHPEKVRDNGVLFSAGVIFLRALRLNYYHLNADGEPPRAFSVRLENNNSAPAVVHLMHVAVGPEKQEMSAGHQASVLFLQQSRGGLGAVITIPPHGTWVISRQVANGGELVTGYAEVTELSGEPLQIGVFAEEPTAAWQFRHPLLESQDTHARGAYEISDLHFKVGYKAGESAVIVPLGDLPLPNLLQGAPLKGSYGVLWKGKLILENPFSESADVPISFQPRGGTASATFFMDDRMRQVSAKAYQEVPIAKIDLAPHSRREISVESMPEGGSSYPIRFIIGHQTEKK